MSKKALTYETAAAELDEILGQLTSDDTTLDLALKLYARAAELIAFCNEVLQKAQLQIEEIDAKMHPEEIL